ncbi:MAG: hypothetical protein ACEPOV_08560 [Hyphomicrobiales bacterium]
MNTKKLKFKKETIAKLEYLNSVKGGVIHSLGLCESNTKPVCIPYTDICITEGGITCGNTCATCMASCIIC